MSLMVWRLEFLVGEKARPQPLRTLWSWRTTLSLAGLKIHVALAQPEGLPYSEALVDRRNVQGLQVVAMRVVVSRRRRPRHPHRGQESGFFHATTELDGGVLTVSIQVVMSPGLGRRL